jgi:hypothetical protein
MRGLDEGSRDRQDQCRAHGSDIAARGHARLVVILFDIRTLGGGRVRVRIGSELRLIRGR